MAPTTGSESLLNEPIPLAQYLFERLKQAGVQSVFGVPGDYNLVSLDYVLKAGLTWVGDANELNAGYAADGYGRLAGISALMTTFGVGELSALNAVAGAYSEYVPVVHIVGCPSTVAQKEGMLLHHTLGNGDFNVFKRMAGAVAETVVDLSEGGGKNAAEMVDDAIQTAWVKSRPVYLWWPTDVVEVKVEGERLKEKLVLEYKDNDKEVEEYVTDAVLNHLGKAKNPMILVDACAVRHRAVDEVAAFIKASGLPVVTSPMGKGAVDETLPNYCGVYAGSASRPEVKERVEASDLVLTVGSIKSDFNTAGFTYRVSQLHTIDFHSNTVKVKYSEYPGVRMNGVLKALTKRIGEIKLNIVPGPSGRTHIPKAELESSSDTITHAWLWPRLSEWHRSGDVVVTETGTSNFGIMDTSFLAPNITAVNQYLWGSIGYATGAAQGVAQAAKERENIKRTILWTGDGSFQLTAQSVSTMLRNDLHPIIFIIRNFGYTIERFIHGMKAEYNDVQEWRYSELLSAFGAREEQYKTYSAKTKKEFEALLADEEFSSAETKKLRFVEVHMPTEDAPESLKITSAAAAKNVGGG